MDVGYVMIISDPLDVLGPKNLTYNVQKKACWVVDGLVAWLVGLLAGWLQ